MSLTYGYDLKDYKDDMIAAPLEATNSLSPLLLPGALLVNHLPFRTDARSITPYFGLNDLFSAAHPIVDPIFQL